MDVNRNCYYHMLCIVITIFSFSQSSSSAVYGFNAVVSKTIDANVTCGNPKEIYYKTQEGSLHPRLRTRYVCDANDVQNAHPPIHMIDGDLATFWQSKASVDKATIRIDFNQEVFGYELSVTFGDYRRPEHLAFYKSRDYGATFQPWHFLVSPPATEQCRDVFGMEVTSNPENVDTVICEQYPSYFPLEYNETFTIDMNGKQRGDGSSDSNFYTPEMLIWMKITNLKIIFTGLYKKFDRLSTEWHHYAVREVGLTAKCNCHGFADGFDCPLDVASKERKCRCKGNTCGLYCEKCCPAYNQYPWRQGDGAPWVWNGTTICQECNCHNHSDICVYNDTIATQRLSLDVDGKYQGGGVCVDCKHNTEGINCEKCKTFYYRPINRSKLSLETCEVCGCNIGGTRSVLNMKYLDCVRDELQMKFHQGKSPGDCYCKTNVEGRSCDTCKDEFYELSENNPEGCQGCDCHLPGTVNASDVCEKNNAGQCLCKLNTQGRTCAQCKPGFFDLKNENVNGCEDCGCDPGASVLGSFCNNITGICHCLPRIYGKQCKSIEVGWYYPDLHFISAERNLYHPASSMLSVTLDIPKSGYFRIVVGYLLKVSESARINIQLLSNFGDILLNSNLTKCAAYCQHNVLPSFFNLNKGEVHVVVNSTQDDLKLEHVAAIPQEFYESTVLDVGALSRFQFQCNIDHNDMRLGTNFEEYCLSNVFSLTIAYNNGPLSCNCNLIGSYNSSCDTYGGQCYCKPGVTGRECSQCLPEFYNLSDSGCKPCGCLGENKYCNVTTGWCKCPSNTAQRTCQPCQCNGNTDTCLRTGECLNCQNNSTGFHCEKCIEGTYGNASVSDCKDCKCDQLGSLDTTCDVVTGQCHCKKNVGGRNCSQCRPNAFNMSVSGCEECHCNPHGSTNLQCDRTGQCPCFENVEGIKCTQCLVGYYGLSKKPCAACACSSIGSVSGTNCTNDELGMCVCKPGVSGRACDTCKKQYTNFTMLGCSRCTGCSRNLQSQLNRMNATFLNISREVGELQNFSEIDNIFIKLNERVEMAKISNVEYDSRIIEFQEHYRALLQLFGSQFVGTQLFVTSQNDLILNFITILTAENKAILDNLLKIKSKTENSTNVAAIPELVKDLTRTFSNLTESINKNVNEAQEIFVQLSNVNVENEMKLVQDSLKIAQNLSERVRHMTNEVLAQDTLAQSLELSMNKAVKTLMENQDKTELDHNEFMGQIKDIYGSFSAATALVDNIKNINQASKTFIERATAIVELSKDTAFEADKTLEKAKLIYQEYKVKSVASQGELEISMLQYDFKQSIFLMKILQARNLLGRDLPSGTSDPYAIISILPAWHGQPTQKSRIINETTSPTFPFYDIFRFHISVEEIPLTKLIITLYDYDDDDDDDCLGEVVIDLKECDFFNQIVTKWIKVQPKGSTSFDTGNFDPDGIGFIDLTTLLEIQISQLTPNMNHTENKLTEAKNNVTNLKNHVDLINGSLQEAFNYAEEYRKIIELYESIPEITSSVVDGGNKTKEAVDKLRNYLKQRSVSEMNEDFEKIHQEVQELHTIFSTKNSSWLENLEKSIETANKTFVSSLSRWKQVNQNFIVLQAKTSKFKAESSKESTILELISFGYNISRIMYYKISKITNECERLVAVMVPMVTNITQVFSLAANHTQIINEGVSSIAKADAKLTTKSTPSENVLVALPIKENFEKNRDPFSQRISDLEEKLSHILNQSLTLGLAMLFTGNGSTIFAPSKSFLENKLSNNIVFDFKTNNSQGGLVYVVTSSKDLSKSIRLFVANGKLCSSTDVGNGPTTLCHPDNVNDGKWHRAFFTRYGLFYTLTIADNNGSYSSVNKTSTKNILELYYSQETMFYVGGLPPGILDGVLNYYGPYNGVIDHLRINTDALRLWSPDDKYGEQLFHCNKCFPKHPPGPMYEAHFFGTGGLWHRMGEFRINASNIVVEFDFRAILQTAVLLEVKNVSNTPIVGIYLVDGVMKCLLQKNEEKVIVTSEGSSYCNGQWHTARFSISNSTALLQVKRNVSSTWNTSSKHLNGNWPESVTSIGAVLVFGGPSTNSISSLTRAAFAGDLKNIKLGNTLTSEKIPLRDLVGAEWLEDKGVSYDGVIKENVIVSGIRLFGYLPYKGYGSYAVLEREQEQVLHVLFTFKTFEKDGIFMYNYNKVQGTFFYMALWDGFLYISFNNGDFNGVSPLHYKDQKLNDNMWYTVSLNFTNAAIHLELNGVNIYTGWFGNGRAPLVFTRLYVGGVEPTVLIHLPVPVYWSFQGAFQIFAINLREIKLSDQSSGISIGGVSSPNVLPTFAPSTQASPTPTSTPQCAEEPVVPRSMNDLKSVNLGASSFDHNLTTPSYIGFYFNEKQKGFFKQSLVVTLEMRSLTMNGVIFYAADSETDPKEFVSLELVNGRLRYQFSSGTGKVSIQTIQRYALNAIWYKVYLLRVYQLGAIVVPRTREYHNNRHQNAPSKININTPFYIGGLPTHVKAPSLIHRNFSFIGCLRNFQITSSEDEDLIFDLNNPDLTGASAGQCQHHIEPGAYFNGKAWMRYDNVYLPKDFTISFRFRTNQRSGLLFAFDGINGKGLVLHQKLGKLVLKYINGLSPVELEWSPSSSSTSDIPSPYMICQMEWYTIKIIKQGGYLKIIVNGHFEVMDSVSDGGLGMNGAVMLGQHSGSELSSEASSFYGCLKQLIINGVLFDPSRPTSQVNAQLSCPVYESLA